MVLNVGGIANITVLPRDYERSVTGFDTGPGNGLMNTWTAQHRHEPYDDEGKWAASGSVNRELLSLLLDDPFFSRTPPKSADRQDFQRAWLQQALTRHPSVTAADVQATLCELTARSIVNAIGEHGGGTQRVLVCGGGIHNKQLLARLESLLSPVVVESTACHGLEPDWVEAVALAWLAKRALQGRAGNVPTVTGADEEVVLGGVYRNSSAESASP